VVRFCRACQTSKPSDQFHPNGHCRSCVRQGRGPRLVRVDLPPGWSSRQAGLPEISIPTQAERDAGYVGDVWIARKLSWRIEVVWRGDIGRFRCRVIKNEEVDRPRDDRMFDYPHEVVEWVGNCFARLAQAKS